MLKFAHQTGHMSARFTVLRAGFQLDSQTLAQFFSHSLPCTKQFVYQKREVFFCCCQHNDDILYLKLFPHFSLEISPLL